MFLHQITALTTEPLSFDRAKFLRSCIVSFSIDNRTFIGIHDLFHDNFISQANVQIKGQENLLSVFFTGSEISQLYYTNPFWSMDFNKEIFVYIN